MAAVEVVYVLADRAEVRSVDVAPGARVRDAIERSGLLQDFPEIDLTRNRVGVFGTLRKLDDPVAPGERVEIYRPLLNDPKELRRKRATSSASG